MRTEPKPRGYWESLENTLAEAKAAMEREGWATLPSKDLLVNKGYSSLTSAITRYHGGFHKFRNTIGQAPLQRIGKSWESIDNTVAEAKAAMKKEGWTRLPSSNALNHNGYSSLVYAICTHHGGMSKFRLLLGQEEMRRDSGLWSDINYTIRQAQEVMRHEGWATLHSMAELQNKGNYSLVNAITKYHGGIVAFRKLLSEKTGINPDKAKLETILRRYVAEN